MDPETRDIDIWMKETLNSWAEQGALSSDKSAQLQISISKLANREKKNHFKRKVCRFVAAIITFLWFLLANCQVAAAAYMGNTIDSTHSFQLKLVSLTLVLLCYIANINLIPKSIVISR